jgi:type III secretion protein C
MADRLIKKAVYILFGFIAFTLFLMIPLNVVLAKTPVVEEYNPEIEEKTDDNRLESEEMMHDDIEMKQPQASHQTKTNTRNRYATNQLEMHISYYVLQQSINSALKDVATQIGLPIVIAQNVKGKVAAGKYEGSARDILNALVADLNLHWYFDGRTIHVTSVQDAVMHVVQLNSYSFDTLSQALNTIKLDTREFPLRYDERNHMVIIYGPPKYVATIEVVANHLAVKARYKPDVIRG